MSQQTQTIFRRFNTVGFRMTATAVFLIGLSTMTGYFFYQNAANYIQDAETVSGLATRVTDVFEADVLLYELVRAEKDFVLTAEEEFRDERSEFSGELDRAFDELIEGSLTDESRSLLQELKDRKVDYDKNFETAVGIYAPFTRTGGFGRGLAGEDSAFASVKDLSLTNTDILIAAETNLISKIVEIDVNKIETTLEAARENSTFARNISLIAIVGALVVGSIVSFFVIRGVTSGLRSILERLVNLTGVLRDSVLRATDVANRNATTASQLASSSAQQSKQVEEITTTITQTASGITGVATLAQEGSASANQVNVLSQKGGEGAEKASASLEEISRIVSGAVEQIGTLATSSREVGELAGEVTSIADQTNILALNAAIEAARAGEAGRGFAVVADEVRRLAESSRQFADQITRLINSVVDQAQTTARSTSEGAKEITESTTIINTSLASFKQISDAVSEASAKIQQISTNISQQAQSAEQISKTAQSISRGIEQNSSSATGVADSADQQKVVISTIEKSLEEAQILLTESRALVGLRGGETDASPQEVPEVDVESEPAPEPQPTEEVVPEDVPEKVVKNKKPEEPKKSSKVKIVN